MAVIPIRITVFYSQDLRLVHRQLQDCRREGYLAMGKLWAGPLLEEHFTRQARYIFGHTPRTQKYNRRKRALAAIGGVVRVEDGGEVDIVFSGATKRAAMRAKFAVRATDQKFEVPIVGPRYFPARNRRRINMGRELLAVTDRHLRRLTNAGEQAFSRKVVAIRAASVFRTKA